MAKRTNISGIRNKNSGFTLLEVLVAITILTIAVIGPLTLATKSISSAMISKNRITAFYLAQEAIEYIRNIRDSNILKGQDWLSNLGSCLDVYCYIDVIRDNQKYTEIFQCPAKGCPKMKYDTSNDYYNYSTGNETVFIRSIKITKISTGISEGEAKIEVIVDWLEKSGRYSLTLEEHLFDWK